MAKKQVNVRAGLEAYEETCEHALALVEAVRAILVSGSLEELRSTQKLLMRVARDTSAAAVALSAAIENKEIQAKIEELERR